MKKTKIICSIGPSTQTWEAFKGLVEAGMNVARINFSHATLEERAIDEALVKRANEELKTDIAILYDTKGPDLRTCAFQDDKIELIAGNTIRIVEEEIEGTKDAICFNYRGILKSIEIGMEILIDDGFYRLVVEDIDDANGGITCRILNGGIIKSRRGVCIPGIKLDIPYISEQDEADIQYACEHDGDFLAISFVNSKEDIEAVRALCKKYGKETMQIISKVETQYAMDHLDEIVEASDVIMIARGDLGTETGVEKLPLYQQMMIDKCHAKGKRVIMATQMMYSMKTNIRPTNAEVTDVANAVITGCDAIMTSDETTIGNYPVETIKTMAQICETVESYNVYKDEYKVSRTKDITSVIANSVVTASKELNAKVIVAATMSGYTAKQMSNLRPNAFVLAACPTHETARSLALSYGVYTTIVPIYNSPDEVVADAKIQAQKLMDLQKGDAIIVTGGFPNNTQNRTTNFMKIEEI